MPKATLRLTIPPKTFFYRGCLKRDNANNTSLIGTPYYDVFKDTGMSAASASIDADSPNSALQITVTGLLNRPIRWVAVVDICQVSFSTTI